MDKEIISRLKHIETFYEQAPPGYVKEKEDRPEDCIPDEECNKAARDFLANAPSKGLWMPLGKEVKVMQCWRCKQYGHRTGDRECPLFKSGNAANEEFREAYEDPMYHFVEKSKRDENEKKKMWLQHLVDMPTTSDSSSDEESNKKKKKKKSKKKKHKHDKSSDKAKKHKLKKSPRSSSSESDAKKIKKDSESRRKNHSHHHHEEKEKSSRERSEKKHKDFGSDANRSRGNSRDRKRKNGDGLNYDGYSKGRDRHRSKR